MTNVLISAAGLCGATIIGAILGFFVKELPHKWNDAVLGYCAGIMLAASTLGLIVPAFEQTGLWWLVVIGVMAGALFLNVLDLVTPHLHHITGLDPEEHRNNARLSHVMLFLNGKLAGSTVHGYFHILSWHRDRLPPHPQEPRGIVFLPEWQGRVPG